MQSRLSAREWKVMLSLVGGISALIGALLLSMISFPAMLEELHGFATEVPRTVSYVSGDDKIQLCVTCHEEIPGNALFKPRVIDSALLNPHPANVAVSEGWAYRLTAVSALTSPLVGAVTDYQTSYILRGSREEQTP